MEKVTKVFTTITGLLTPFFAILTVTKPDWFNVDDTPALVIAVDGILISIQSLISIFGGKKLSPENLW